MSDKPKCRDSKALGTACGKCSKCQENDKPIKCPNCGKDMCLSDRKIGYEGANEYCYKCVSCVYRTQWEDTAIDAYEAARNQQ